jgi:hypothetical protein
MFGFGKPKPALISQIAFPLGKCPEEIDCGSLPWHDPGKHRLMDWVVGA